MTLNLRWILFNASPLHGGQKRRPLSEGPKGCATQNACWPCLQLWAAHSQNQRFCLRS